MPDRSDHPGDPGWSAYESGQRRAMKRPPPPRSQRRMAGGEVIDLIDEDERCDPEFESAEAARRRKVFEEGQADKLKDRQRRRILLPLGQRLELALRQLTPKIGGMRVRPMESTRGGESERVGPPEPGDDELLAEVQRHHDLIRGHVEGIEAVLDGTDGLLRLEGTKDGFYGTPGAAGTFAATGRVRSTGERDRIIWEQHMGQKSEDVAREFPYLGGNKRTIERARVEEAKRRGVRVQPSTGVVLGEARERKAA